MKVVARRDNKAISNEWGVTLDRDAFGPVSLVETLVRSEESRGAITAFSLSYTIHKPKLLPCPFGGIPFNFIRLREPTLKRLSFRL